MRSRSTDQSDSLPLIAIAVVSLFTIEQLRLFVSGLAFALASARDTPLLVVGLIGVAVSSLALLSVTMIKAMNRSSVMMLVVLVCAIRVGSQVTVEPPPLLGFAAFGVVVGGLVLPGLAVVYGGRIIGAGLVMGGALDIAVMAGRHTLDLPRSSSGLAVLVVVGLGLAAFAALVWEQQVSGRIGFRSGVPAAAAFAIGPWFAVHLNVTGNLGFVSSVSGLDLAPSAAIAGLGAMLGLAWMAPGRSAPHPAVAGAVGTVSLILVARVDGGLAAFFIVVASVAVIGTVAGAFERETTGPVERVAWASGTGLVVGFLGLAVVYAPVLGVSGLSPQVAAALLGVPLLGAGLVSMAHRGLSSAPWRTPAIVATALLIVPAVLALRDSVTTEQFTGDPFVLTYNLNHGFGSDGRLALESMALIIESAAPDIVALQEVSRGWPATGGIDMVAWLEHRLGMPVIFAPTGDRQWGLALATRLPTADPLTVPLGPESAVLGRAALDVPVTIAPDIRLRVVVAQLHQDIEDTDIRIEQANDLVLAWGGVERTVVVGDFGAASTEAALATLFEAGLVDMGRWVDGAAHTWPALQPIEQRDYVLVSPDLGGTSAARIIMLVASDHLPVHVRIGLRSAP